MLNRKNNHQQTEIQAYSQGIKVFYKTILLVIMIISVLLGTMIFMLKA